VVYNPGCCISESLVCGGSSGGNTFVSRCMRVSIGEARLEEEENRQNLLFPGKISRKT
jgi:hypothetical protein